MAKVLIPLIDGFEEVEAITVIDLLRRAEIDILTAGIDKKDATGSHDINVRTDTLLSEVIDADYDMIVLPGGPGTKELKDVAGLQHRLKKQIDSGKEVAAICAAPSILAAAGLLNGRRATCFPAVEDKLAEVSAEISHEEVVEDGQITTSRGAGTAIPFALRLIARLAGEEKAREVAGRIIFRQKD